MVDFYNCAAATGATRQYPVRCGSPGHAAPVHMSGTVSSKGFTCNQRCEELCCVNSRLPRARVHLCTPFFSRSSHDNCRNSPLTACFRLLISPNIKTPAIPKLPEASLNKWSLLTGNRPNKKSKLDCGELFTKRV